MKPSKLSYEHENAIAFRKALENLFHKSLSSDEEKVWDRYGIKEAFLNVSSHSDENIEAIETVAYTFAPDHKGSDVWRQVFCVECQDCAVEIADILWHLEGMSVPGEIQAMFPKLDDRGWQSAMRFLIILLGSYDTNTQVRQL